MLAAAGGLTAAIVASSDDGPILCPYRRCTGGYCPGCGLTRATGALLRGGVVGSWRHHPFPLIALAEALAIAAWIGARRVLGQPRSDAGIRSVLGARTIDDLLWLNGLVLLGLWALRLATGQIPGPLGL